MQIIVFAEKSKNIEERCAQKCLLFFTVLLLYV